MFDKIFSIGFKEYSGRNGMMMLILPMHTAGRPFVLKLFEHRASASAVQTGFACLSGS
ncbi:hypothetical protein LPW36_15880 [Jinshanibacter sp. LJY008]|uniref:Uncharacterized protein n=1 Tax=Limnobaculum eriocheiris TaxID=2897391 RepID=A0A9X1N083_9GAMM|nr:hypothetical protein [Limnobaculum eriocheiris]MCD1127455.1 hypothetical protein [Limnobaculum eriocheiris]